MKNTYFDRVDTVSLPFCPRYDSTTTIFTPPRLSSRWFDKDLGVAVSMAAKDLRRSLFPVGMVHAVNKGQLFDSPITHLRAAGNRKEKRRMKELWKTFHAPNFD
jgi:hypothetical protein